jgi:hypothetical protein
VIASASSIEGPSFTPVTVTAIVSVVASPLLAVDTTVTSNASVEFGPGSSWRPSSRSALTSPTGPSRLNVAVLFPLTFTVPGTAAAVRRARVAPPVALSSDCSRTDTVVFSVTVASSLNTTEMAFALAVEKTRGVSSTTVCASGTVFVGAQLGLPEMETVTMSVVVDSMFSVSVVVIVTFAFVPHVGGVSTTPLSFSTAFTLSGAPVIVTFEAAVLAGSTVTSPLRGLATLSFPSPVTDSSTLTSSVFANSTNRGMVASSKVYVLPLEMDTVLAGMLLTGGHTWLWSFWHSFLMPVSSHSKNLLSSRSSKTFM